MDSPAVQCYRRRIITQLAESATVNTEVSNGQLSVFEVGRRRLVDRKHVGVGVHDGIGCDSVCRPTAVLKLNNDITRILFFIYL